MSATGLIVMWHGLLANIPPGWLLCDGTYGTPDLREKFIRAPADGIDPGGTGGSETHTHDFTGSGHTHDFVAGAAISAGIGADTRTNSGNAVGTTNPGSSLPPYYALAFLMKA